MDILKLLGVIGLFCCAGIAVGFGGYVLTTTRALRAKDKEIANLKIQLKKAQKKERIEVIHTVKDGRIPEFNNF